MNKGDLVKAVYNRNDLTQKEANTVVNSVLDILSDALRREDVVIPGFGKFTSKVRAARTGRNPLTGESMEFPAKRVVSFKAGRSLKETVNS